MKRPLLGLAPGSDERATEEVKRMRRGPQSDPAAVAELERFVFGDICEPIANEQPSDSTRRPSKGRKGGKRDSTHSDLKVKSKVEHFEDEKPGLVESDESPAVEDENESEDGGTTSASDEPDDAEKAAWVDSDDEELAVNISLYRGLRRLRKDEDESVIGGREYGNRLRELYKKTGTLGLKKGSAAWADALRQRTAEAEALELTDAQVDSTLMSAFSDDDEDEAPTVKMEDAEGGGQSASHIVGKRNSLRKREQKRKMKFDAIATPVVSQKETTRLMPHTLDYRVLTDATATSTAKAMVMAAQFVPGTDLLYEAGFDKTIRVFRIDRKENPLVSSVFVPGCPIRDAKVIPSSYSTPTSILFIGGRCQIADYDLESGAVTLRSQVTRGLDQKRFDKIQVSPDLAGNTMLKQTFAASSSNGYIMLGDTRTKSVIRKLKLNSKVGAFVYHPSEDRLLAGDAEGKVYDWDIGSGRCVLNFADEGSIGITAMAASDSLVAVGSGSGHINIYDVNNTRITLQSDRTAGDTLNKDGDGFDEEEQPSYLKGTVFSATQPLKSIDNLTTAVTALTFHPSNELLAGSSLWEKDAVKLVHLPSYTVFANFPTVSAVWGSRVKRVNTIDFNDKGDLMALGNDHGTVQLYRLNHFA